MPSIKITGAFHFCTQEISSLRHARDRCSGVGGLDDTKKFLQCNNKGKYLEEEYAVYLCVIAVYVLRVSQ